MHDNVTKLRGFYSSDKDLRKLEMKHKAKTEIYIFQHLMITIKADKAGNRMDIGAS